jgi:hypothetical protein
MNLEIESANYKESIGNHGSVGDATSRLIRGSHARGKARKQLPWNLTLDLFAWDFKRFGKIPSTPLQMPNFQSKPPSWPLQAGRVQLMRGGERPF